MSCVQGAGDAALPARHRAGQAEEGGEDDGPSEGHRGGQQEADEGAGGRLLRQAADGWRAPKEGQVGRQ